MAEPERHGRDRADQVAVIGLAGRFPGARDPAELWRNLRDGVESVSFFDAEELRAAGVGREEASRPDYVGARGYLDGIELFDAGFFGFSPREAELMDPQQRLLLECAWHALEDAGYGGPRRPEAIGVWAACGINNYLTVNLLRNPEVLRAVGAGYVRVANRLDNLATRVSYKLDLRGPSVAVQTGCSSSLVAVHLACQSLLSGESDLALAGGVRVNVLGKRGYVAEEGSVLSPDGHTRTFDARGAGTIVADGVGAVVLKRLEDALGDGDPVRAVILGSAVNNDGSRKIGYTAPSVEGQARVVSEALAMASVAADSISYVEAHGTATPLGDPIEIAGLTQAFRATTERSSFCAIGSIKSNFGHLDAAAGVAGLIKTVLALGHRQIPPSLHFERPNPEIDFAHSPFRVADRLRSWPDDAGPRRAGVSSFGIGGTNVHVVVEEAPPAAPSGPGRPVQLLAVSARSPEAVLQAGSELAAYLGERPDLPAADVAYTLQVGRQAFEHRRARVLRPADETPARAAADLADPAAEGTVASAGPAVERPVVFLFPGQGAQRPGMAATLYRDEPLFRAEVDRCLEIAAPHLGFDLLAVLDPRPADGARLTSTEVAQPALFVVEYALARLWMGWGVRPDAMVGHSLGEYVAACLAGVMSLEDALALIAVRGRLMQGLAPGAMLAVPLPPERLRERLGEALSLAAVNGPAECVVSGPSAAVDALRESLAAEGHDARRLRTERAFHSALVEPVAAAFAERLRAIDLRPPRIAFLSNLTGTWIRPDEATDPGYWLAHQRRTVRFTDNLTELLREPSRALLEVGPGRTLSGFARRHPDAGPDRVVVASLPGTAGPDGEDDGPAALLTALGRLWCAGVEIDWGAVHDGERRHRVALPAYPFERHRYWIEPAAGRAGSAARRAATLQKRPDLGEWLYTPSWKRLAPLGDDAPGAGLTWWLLAPEGGPAGDLAALLGARLAAGDATVVTVRPAAPGAALRRLNDGSWALDPADAAGYRELLAALDAEGLRPDRVGHLWTLGDGPEPRPEGPRERFDAWQRAGFLSLIHLACALTDRGAEQPCRIVAVTDGAEEVIGGEPLVPSKTTLAGACRVLPQEHPELSCRLVDAGGAPPACLAPVLAAELAAEAAPPVVALRHGIRWQQTFEPLPLPSGPASAGAGPPARLRRRGVYLLFGGLGRIALALAEWLVRDLDARLVLAGRHAPPAPGERDAWLAGHDDADPVSRTIRRLREALGPAAEDGRVTTVIADVSVEAEVRAAVAAARAHHGALHGVVHSAGLTRSFSPARETTAETAALQFRPKAHGCLALEAALGGEELDFVLLLSSLSAVLGGFGHAAHAAAHRFLDAFALESSRAGRVPWLSVDLDGWSFGETDGVRRGAEKAAELAMTPAEGVAAIRLFLDQSAVGQAVVSTGDLALRAAHPAPGPATERSDPEPADAPASADHGRPSLPNAFVAPETEPERRIAEIWQELLGLAPVGVTDDFFELGGHSLLGAQIVSRLRAAFRVEIPMRRVFERTTVRELAALVQDVLLAEIEEMSEEEAERMLGDSVQ